MKPELQRSNEDIKARFLSLQNNNDLADLLEISTTTLTYYAYRLPKGKQYTSATILKRSGKKRIIHAPISNLKILQQKLNYILQVSYQPRYTAFGFIKKRNAIDNARIHKNPLFVLHIDLKDFFDQIHFGRVKGIFMSQYPFGFDTSVANTIANITTYNGTLPQGAPSSPAISNLVCWKFDKEVEDLARKFGCKYTRYADDITISSRKHDCPPQIARSIGSTVVLGDILLAVFSRHNLVINQEKSSLRRRGQRQMITGIVVNKKVNVKREYLRDVRKDLFFWEKYGIDEAKMRHRPFLQKVPYKNAIDYRKTIKGKLDYIKQVKELDKNDISYSSYLTLRKWLSYIEIRDAFNQHKERNAKQDRGYFLERAFTKLFALNKIEVKEPFRRRGGADQIDGAVFLNGATILIECKWTDSKKTINKEIDSFQTKIKRSGALGIFISIAGWNDNAIKNRVESPDKDIVLMNGEEFELLISNRKIDIGAVLQWKLNTLRADANPFAHMKEYLAVCPV